MTDPVLPVTAEQARLQAGARLALATRRQFPSTVVPATGPGWWVTFAGTEDLTAQLAANGANQVQLGFSIARPAGPPGAGVLVYLNPAGPAPTFAGSVAFFAHEGHAPTPYRLPITAALKRAGGAGAVTVSFVPVDFPGLDGPALDVTATLFLVQSTVER
jgi:hypothetical protein